MHELDMLYLIHNQKPRSQKPLIQKTKKTSEEKRSKLAGKNDFYGKKGRDLDRFDYRSELSYVYEYVHVSFFFFIAYAAGACVVTQRERIGVCVCETIYKPTDNNIHKNQKLNISYACNEQHKGTF